MTKSQTVQLSVGLIAQLAEHYTGITEVMGSNLSFADNFFRLYSAYITEMTSFTEYL